MAVRTYSVLKIWLRKVCVIHNFQGFSIFVRLSDWNFAPVVVFSLSLVVTKFDRSVIYARKGVSDSGNLMMFELQSGQATQPLLFLKAIV